MADDSRPRKRQRKTVAHELAAYAQPIPKGTACSTCRKSKVKCNSSERGMGSCSRCRRLGLQCLSEKRSWTAVEGEDWQPQLMLVKLERALEDVLDKLKMPALDLYAPAAIEEPTHSPRSTRQNSEEPVGDERNTSPGPMNSLMEATRLNGLTSRLRSGKQRRKGGMRRMDSDLISEKVLNYAEAEEMLDLFKRLLSHHLFSAAIPLGASLETIRTSSTVLFTAIMLVSALHIPGKERLHEICHSRFLGLVSSAIFDRFHTLDDIRGLCIAAIWQPDLSWKLSGLCIRMATELNLHHAFYEVFHTPNITDDTRKECLEKARIWYLLYVLDHQSSITFARPPVMSELRPIREYEAFLRSSWCTPGDHALTAEVTGFVILSRAFDTFGLEPMVTMGGDDASLLNHMRFTEDARSWRDRWSSIPPERSTEYLSNSVQLHYFFTELVLNSLVLRGRSLDKMDELPNTLRPLTLRAVEAAHSILQHFIKEPAYREGIVGMPLYLHSMIAFAVVFLMKTSHRWHAIGITIQPKERTRPLIEGIIELLRGCQAGANHMVFSMANGFERMLKQSSSRSRRENTHRIPPANRTSTWSGGEVLKGSSLPFSQLETRNSIQNMPSNTESGTDYSQQQYDANVPPSSNHEFQMVSPTSAQDISYTNWGFQDEELWSLGMGYDLLAPGGQGVMNSDFPFLFYDDNNNNNK